MQIIYFLAICLGTLVVVLIFVVAKYRKKVNETGLLREKVIGKAEEKAEKIIENAATVSASLEEHISRIIKEKTHESLNNILGSLKNSADSDLRQFTDEIKNETSDFKALYNQKLAQEIEKIEFDLEGYKKARRMAADKEAGEMVKKIVKEALGEELDEAKHEEIVKRALDKAVEAGAFKK